MLVLPLANICLLTALDELGNQAPIDSRFGDQGSVWCFLSQKVLTLRAVSVSLTGRDEEDALDPSRLPTKWRMLRPKDQ